MEEKPFFAPSGSSPEPEGGGRQEKPKISFSPRGGDKKPKKSKATKSSSGGSPLKNLSIKKILLALLVLVALFLLLQNTICAGGSDPAGNNTASQEGSTTTETADAPAGDSAVDSGTEPDSGSGSTPLPGNSEGKEYSGDAVILINDTIEITSEEISEREGLIGSYLETNNITDLTTEDKKEAAISQLLQVAWAKAAAEEAGITISAREISKASKGPSQALTKNLQAAGYSAAQIEDLIRLELVRRVLQKDAVKKAKKVKMSQVRKVYKKSKSKKPFKKVKKKLKKKIRVKQVKKAKKGFQPEYERLWSSRTACSPDYTVAAYCGQEL